MNEGEDEVKENTEETTEIVTANKSKHWKMIRKSWNVTKFLFASDML